MKQMTIIDNLRILTMDDSRNEYARGYLVMEDDRISEVGSGRLPDHFRTKDASFIDGTGRVATPGLVNTHEHLFQGLTPGRGYESGLFPWLSELYPIWSRIDADSVYWATQYGAGSLLLSGCSTTSDHPYLFPKGGGDIFEAEVEAAIAVGIRFHPTRGSMDLGESSGGLPPDSVVESTSDALSSTEEAISRYHDPSYGAMVRVGVSPCSPFSVSKTLMSETASLAREKEVILHTHLAETVNEKTYCESEFGCTPLEYIADLGWTGKDVWLAHGIYFTDSDIDLLSRTRTGITHCPTSNGRLGSGVFELRRLLDSGVPIGLGVDGPGCNDRHSALEEVRQAVLVARAINGPSALTVRDSLWLATRGGAQLLGRDDEIGSIAPGMMADIAIWNANGGNAALYQDPIVPIVMGNERVLDRLYVHGVCRVKGGSIEGLDLNDVGQTMYRESVRISV